MTKALPVPLWNLFDYKPNEWAYREVHLCEARFAAFCTCRQVGKTFTLSMEIMDALTQPKDPLFGPPLVGVLSFDFPHAMISIDRLMESLKRAGIPIASQNMNEHWLKLDNGATLRWFSSDDPYAVAGYTYSAFFIDEAQKVPDDVYTKLRPALDVRNAYLRAFGTPDTIPEQSWFEGLYLRGQDELEQNYYSYTVSCIENRWMSLESIREAYEDLTEREFRMLYLGEWVDSDGKVFHVKEEQFDSPMLKKREKNGMYVMGLDIGTMHDYTVAYIGDAKANKFVDGFRVNGLTYPDIEQRIIDLYRKWGASSVLMEANGPGKPVADALRLAGLSVTDMSLTNKLKSEVIQNLERQIEHNRVHFLKGDNQLKRELKAYTRKVSPSGNVLYTAPANFFDDTVIAAAYTVYKMRNPGRIRTSSYAYN